MRIMPGFVLALTVSAANAQTVACLQARQLEGFDYKTDREAVAIMENSDRFNVRFAGRCGYTKFHPQLTFQMPASDECFKVGSVLHPIDGGSCVVEEITPASR